MYRIFLFLYVLKQAEVQASSSEVDCDTLRMGQYLCPDPDANYVQTLIDPKTQQLRGCTQENKARSRYSITALNLLFRCDIEKCCTSEFILMANICVEIFIVVIVNL